MSNPLCYSLAVRGVAIDVYVVALPTVDADSLPFLFRARAPAIAGSPATRPLTLTVHRHGLVARGMRLTSPYWRRWATFSGPQQATNTPELPDGLAAGDTKTDTDGVLWHGLSAKPAAALDAPLGSWAVDLLTGAAYKRVRPQLQKLAESVAEELVADIDLQAELAGLPTLD